MNRAPTDRRPPEQDGAPGVARILLVDDVRRLVELMKNYLKRTTCQVLTARNGEEALRMCRREAPDLVFLDASMEGSSGIEICRTMKADRLLGGIPVVIVAARGGVDECLQAGCDDVLTKPVVQEDFLDRVRRFVALRERGEDRIPVSLRVEIKTGAGRRAVYTRDLSPQGTFLKTDRPLPIGTRVALTVHFPGGREPLDLEAEVRRVVRPTTGGHLLPGMGVCFVSASTRERRILQEFINERLSG